MGVVLFYQSGVFAIWVCSISAHKRSSFGYFCLVFQKVMSLWSMCSVFQIIMSVFAFMDWICLTSLYWFLKDLRWLAVLYLYLQTSEWYCLSLIAFCFIKVFCMENDNITPLPMCTFVMLSFYSCVLLSFLLISFEEFVSSLSFYQDRDDNDNDYYIIIIVVVVVVIAIVIAIVIILVACSVFHRLPSL